MFGKLRCEINSLKSILAIKSPRVQKTYSMQYCYFWQKNPNETEKERLQEIT